MNSVSSKKMGLLAVLSLALIATASTFGQTANATQTATGEKFNQHQLSRLIASAKTPADHAEIARYYEARAQQYMNESKSDAVKIDAYRKSPYLGECLMCVNSNYSLEAAIRSLRLSERISEDRAAKMEQLAQQQEQMSGSNATPTTTSGQ